MYKALFHAMEIHGSRSKHLLTHAVARVFLNDLIALNFTEVAANIVPIRVVVYAVIDSRLSCMRRRGLGQRTQMGRSSVNGLADIGSSLLAINNKQGVKVSRS